MWLCGSLAEGHIWPIKIHSIILQISIVINSSIPLFSSPNPVNPFAAHCISHSRNNFKGYAIELKWLRMHHTVRLLWPQFQYSASMKEIKFIDRFPTITFSKFFLFSGLVTAVLFPLSPIWLLLDSWARSKSYTAEVIRISWQLTRCFSFTSA